jgi:hypothetical protein
VERVARRLHRHAVWDLALLAVPPLGVGLYALFSLAASGALGLSASALLGAAALAAAALLVAVHSIGKAPSIARAARLVDLKVRGQERFVTIATVDPTVYPEPLVARLDAEASALASRLRLRADFPYRPKRSGIVSLAASLLALAIFQILFSRFAASGRVDPAALSPETETAGELLWLDRSEEARRLLERLRDPGLSPGERKQLMERLREQLAQERGLSEQEKAAASEYLNRLERDLSEGSGGETERRERGAGGIESNVPGEAKGAETKSASGGSADQRGTEKGGEPSEAKADAENKAGEPRRPSEADKAGQSPRAGEQKAKGEAPGARRGEGAGGIGQPEETKQTPPPDRFYPFGHGEKGLKGAGYVTVELPEAEDASQGGSGKEVERKGRRSRVPASNAPLPPAAGPEAARERQPVPLEYRNIIR